MNALKMFEVCKYLINFDEEFTFSVGAFEDIFILDYYKELDPEKMAQLGCDYDKRRHGYTLRNEE